MRFLFCLSFDVKSPAFLSTMRVTIHVVLEKRDYARLLSAHGSQGRHWLYINIFIFGKRRDGT